MTAARHVVLAELAGVGPVRCTRPYPRRDHLDPFGWEDAAAAEAFAAELRARFPGNRCTVAHEDWARGAPLRAERVRRLDARPDLDDTGRARRP